jgi:SAM-dependent methyltransferase
MDAGTGVMASRWLRRLGLQPGSSDESIDLDFPASIARAFPNSFPLAWDAVQDVWRVMQAVDLTPLARRSPALAGYAWRGYLECSVVRMVRVLEALRARVDAGARVVDYGAYFGNVALMLARAGYDITALDSYRAYDGVFAPVNALLERNGCTVHDFAAVEYDLRQIPRSFDGVVCLGVLEHIPHTPRPLLESLTAALRGGGVLVLDTPNMAYLYNRMKLARGESIGYPIAAQYETELPFEGHHREYTVSEVRWLLERHGHSDIAIETFNYSHFALGRLSGEHVSHWRQMERDPDTREIIMAVSRGPER